MRPELWRQIEDVYAAAVTLEPGARQAYLDEACSGNSELRSQVQSLLVANAAAGNFLVGDPIQEHLAVVAHEARLQAVGVTLAHYCILSHIGSGGMGDVYLARDTKLDRNIALKVLAGSHPRNPENISRFLREARAASALNHPNIITIYEIGNAGDLHFIATEFVDGETVRQRLGPGKMDIQEALRITIDTARALEAAHRAGIVHRDVKPENIMIRSDGVVKVLDFGLARLEDSTVPVEKTKSGTILGTPRYMSPEQARGERLDARTDIFSLGAVLYEMVTGRFASPGVSAAETLVALLSREPDRFDPPLPGVLEFTITKALAKDRELRYQTMEEFANALERVDLRGRRAFRINLRKPVLISAIAIVVLGAGLLLWMANRVGQEPSLHAEPLMTLTGAKDHASLSPDGKRIAFAWNGGRGGQRDIYIQTIGAGEPIRLTTAPQDDWLSTWSPDGRFVAFERSMPTGQEVYVIPSQGGPERKLAETGTGLSWSPDGKTLAIAGRGPNSGISLLSLATGAQTQITFPKPYSDSLPAFSPDGRHIAFTRSLSISAREVFVVDVRGGKPVRRTFDLRPTWGLTWTADSRELVFSSNRGGHGHALWRMGALSGEPRVVLNTLLEAEYPTVGRAGGRLVYTESASDTNMYEYHGSGFGAPSGPGPYEGGESVFESSREDHTPAISPDGQRVAFVSKRTGNEEIWLADRATGHQSQLTAFGGPGTGSPRWSPDGKWIAFDSRAEGNPDIYIVSPNGGPPRRFTTDPGSETRPSWSRDGQWIYFSSPRNGQVDVYRTPVTGGPDQRITWSGATEGIEGPGGLVYFIRGSPAGFWSIPAMGGEERKVLAFAQRSPSRHWGIVDEGLYFLNQENTPPQTVYLYRFSTRRVTPLLTVPNNVFWKNPGLSLSADGRLILNVRLDHDVNDIMLVEGFR